MRKTAVVILNYNGAHFLEKFLPLLIEHTPNCDLIVADNCSTDHSIDVLDSFGQSILVKKLGENYGYAGGYNEALKELKYDYFILLNSDVEVTKGWSESLVSLLAEDEQIVAAQPKIKDFKARSKFEYAGAAGGFIDKLGYPYCRGRIFETIEEDVGQYDDCIDIFWASGACFIIRSSVFNELGGFDSSYFAHMEEIDLCWRIKNNGYQIRFQPKSTVYHVGGGTLNKQSPRKTYLNIRNNLLTLYKNLPRSNFLLILIARIVFDVMACVKMSLTFGPNHGLAILKAWRDFIKHPKSIKKTKKHSIVTFPFSIVWQYYVNKRRTFDKL